MDAMTELTQKMYDSAIEMRSAEQAVRLLRENGHFRTLADTLRAFSGCDNPKPMLAEGLMKYNPAANPDSVNKKIGNWMSGRTNTVSKADAFVLCRVLCLSLDQSDAFLKTITGEGIHWRDPEEIIWGYSIAQRLDAGQTQALLQQLAEGKKRAKKEPAPGPGSFTADVREKLQPLLYQSPEELIRFLSREGSHLGAFHNTAYQLFMGYMQLLETGGTEPQAGSEAKMSSRDILETYLYRQLVPVVKREDAKERGAFSAVQRSIRVNWPDEATISRMKKRELDVTRKVLILLFLATDGSESEFEELDEDEDILTRDEIFQNIYTRLNRMLQACGFQLLDPRSPFDWMVLYCICVDDLWDVDQRLKDMLRSAFPEGNEKQTP